MTGTHSAALAITMANEYAQRLESTIRVIERSIEVERRIAESQPHLRVQAERSIEAAEARLARLRRLAQVRR